LIRLLHLGLWHGMLGQPFLGLGLHAGWFKLADSNMGPSWTVLASLWHGTP